MTVASPNRRGMESTFGIDARDAAAAVGLSPFKSPMRLWMEMTGRRDMIQRDAVGAEATATASYWARVIETMLSAHYGLNSGHKPCRSEQLHHPEHPWMLSGGALAIRGSANVQLLMCMAVGLSEAMHWNDEMPLYVRARALHELVVTSSQAIDVMVLLGGRDLQIHRVRVTNRAATQLLKQEEVFWECVQSQRPPSLDVAIDSRLLFALPIERVEHAYAVLAPAS